MSSEKNTSKAGTLTVRFKSNWNNKLYGKYFTSIGKTQHGLLINDIVEIELKGRCVMLAKVVESKRMPFHEIPHFLVQLDTGCDYGNSLEMFKNLGINVNDFDTEVDYIFFESIQVYAKKE